jgi:protein-disulfide isomerase
MAKQQRGSNRAQNRPANAPSNRPSGQRPAGQRPSRKSGTWQPSRVSASAKSSRGPNRTALITIGAVIVGVLIVAFVMVQQLSKQPPASSTAELVTPGNTTPPTIPFNGRTLGQADAPATVDIYGDFRCSACYYFTEAGTEDQLIANDIATGRAKLVWHDYLTIDQDGSNASRDAANAAWCAADQGKFWTMHDWLYANQSPTEAPDAFTIDRLLKIGQAAGMDMSTFTPCVQNGTHDQEIAAEQSSAPAQVTGTPTVFVNGQLVGAQGSVATYDEIKAAIDAVVGGTSPAPSTTASPSG